MKILHASNYMYPHLGGIEQTTRVMANYFKSCGYEQKIICFNEDAEDNGYICHHEETVYDKVDGIDVIRCGYIRKIASQPVSLTFGKEYKKIMDEFVPDIIILQYPNPFLAHYLLKYKNRKFKFILYWNSDIVKQKNIGRLFHFQNIELCERADVIIATTPNYIEGSPYLSKYREKCVIIPCCISDNIRNLAELETDEYVNNKIKEIKTGYKDKIICFSLGRHVPYKGFEYLIDASKRLDDRFKILIGSDGPLTPSLKQRAEGDEKVEFIGLIPDKDLVAYFKACDIFCFPSITKNEAFGMALAEAMYYGKPAVTFTIPGSGVNYVSLNGITGLECPNRDSRSYAEALKRLADDPDLRQRLGEAAAMRSKEEFSEEVYLRNIGKLINE